eukprot:4354885-Amphidinium_carterae.1
MQCLDVLRVVSPAAWKASIKVLPRSLVLAAVEQQRCALEDAAEELKGDREIVLAAVKHDWRAL